MSKMSRWVKTKPGKIPRIKEKTPVHIFVKDVQGNVNIFSAHHEAGLWFLFDPFTNAWRPYHRQQYVTHYKKWEELPK